MAQNITLLGANYSDVPSVSLPKTGGGTASFTDVTDTTATASDVASGKYFYTSSGVLTEGTSSAPNVQIDAGSSRTTSTSYTTLRTLTVGKTGTYDVYWVGFRSSTSGTFGTCLYIGDTLYGTDYTSWNNHGQHVHLSGVSLTKDQVVTARGKSRGSGYYTYVANLLIVEQ